MRVVVNVLGCGGTAESGKSYLGEPGCEMAAARYIHGDRRADIVDLVLIAFHWVEKAPTPGIDIAAGRSGKIV